MRKFVTAVIALSMVGMLPAASSAAPVKSVVKIGAKCTKLNATAKIGSTKVVCKRNAKKVLVWTKVVVETAECKSAKAQFVTQQKAYADIVAKIAEARAAAAGLSGAEADLLKAQINATEESVKPLKAMVDQLSSLTTEICKLGA